MTGAFEASAVLYVKQLPRMHAFYQAILHLDDTAVQVAPDHIALGCANSQLILVAVPAHIAARIVIEQPPKLRTETPLKLVLHVTSIAECRAVAAVNGGEVLAPNREWNFQGYRVCDASDPEGNVLQLREAHW